MVYKEVPLDLIDPNPFQTRTDMDSEDTLKTITGIATSAMDGLGIRNAPLLRPHPEGNERFQIASGELRIKACKMLGKKTMMCRVEDLTDSQMKKEVLVENVNRSDLNEGERFQALEVYRLDPSGVSQEDQEKLKNKNHGWLSLLSRLTGIPIQTLSYIYDIQEMRGKLKISNIRDFSKNVGSGVILSTSGLPEQERIKLVEKAVDRGWGQIAVLKVKQALKEMEPEVRELILEEKTKLPHNVIAALVDVPPEKQAETIKHIRMHKYNEELALKFIERVAAGEDFTIDVVVVNEVEHVFSELERVWEIVSGWGVNQRAILQTRWKEAVAIFRKIEEKMIELKLI